MEKKQVNKRKINEANTRFKRTDSTKHATVHRTKTERLT